MHLLNLSTRVSALGMDLRTCITNTFPGGEDTSAGVCSYILRFKKKEALTSQDLTEVKDLTEEW